MESCGNYVTSLEDNLVNEPMCVITGKFELQLKSHGLV
jgi:hypothetical protein